MKGYLDLPLTIVGQGKRNSKTRIRPSKIIVCSSPPSSESNLHYLVKGNGEIEIITDTHCIVEGISHLSLNEPIIEELNKASIFVGIENEEDSIKEEQKACFAKLLKWISSQMHIRLNPLWKLIPGELDEQGITRINLIEFAKNTMPGVMGMKNIMAGRSDPPAEIWDYCKGVLEEV